MPNSTKLVPLILCVLVAGTLCALALVFGYSGELARLEPFTPALVLLSAVFLGVVSLWRLFLSSATKIIEPRLCSFDFEFGRLQSRTSRLEELALCLLAAMLPMGEGLAFGAAGVLLVVMVHQRFWTQLPPLPLLSAAALGFFVWCGCGALAWIWAPEGWIRPQEIGRVLPFFVFPIVVCSTSRMGPGAVARATRVFLGVLGISSLFALVQYFSSLHESALFMDSIGLISAKHQIHAPDQGARLVAGGFFFHRLKLAHVLLLGLSLLVARQLFVELKPRVRVLELTLLSLFLVTLALTYTRGALVALVLGVGLLLCFASRFWKKTACVVAGLLILIALAYSPLRDRILSIGDAAASQERLLIWQTAFHFILERPWGTGLGNYPSLLEAYYKLTPGAEHLPRTYAHNLLLSAWAETGPLGVIGYCWMWVVLAMTCFNRLRQQRFSKTHFIAAAGLMSLAVMWIVGLTHDVFYHKPVALNFAATIGAIIGAISSPVQRDSG